MPDDEEDGGTRRRAWLQEQEAPPQSELYLYDVIIKCVAIDFGFEALHGMGQSFLRHFHILHALCEEAS